MMFKETKRGPNMTTDSTIQGYASAITEQKKYYWELLTQTV